MWVWNTRAVRHSVSVLMVCCLGAALSGCGGSTMGASASATGSASAGGAASGGGSASASGCSAQTCGTTLVTMTDAKGDFLSYIVSLTSLQLQTANGTSVETIPATTKVDFAKLVDLSEVLSAGQIPQAEYVSAKLTIDFTNAQLNADDGTGNPVALAPIDAAGNPITGPLIVTLQLDPAHHLHVTAGALARLALDFNLAVSNVVDMTAATVTVTPTLVGSLVPSDTQPVRVRGSLVSTTVAQDQFVVAVQPFNDESTAMGQVTVQVSATTTYQINGTAYLGDAGLAALAALPANTKVAAFGTDQAGTQPIITANNILAGTSLQNPGKDRLSGTVIARDLTTLTVRAGTWSNSDGDFDFERHDATVTIGPDTVVVEAGRMGSFTTADISVGQHVDVSGVATRGSDHALNFDASNGQASLKVTELWGTVTTRQTGTLTVNLRSLDGLPATAFDFSGTGGAPANDASATTYILDTGTLDLSAIAMNGFTGARGFVTAFGSAPPDFSAETLISLPAVQAQLNIHFDHGGSATAFLNLTATSTSLQLQLPGQNGGNNGNGNGNGNGSGNSDNSGPGNSGDNRNSGSNGNSGDNGTSCSGDGSGDSGGGDNSLRIGPSSVNLANVPSPLTIVPNASDGANVFTIGHQGPMRSETFTDFGSFVSALSQELSDTVIVHAVSAAGQYDSTSNTLTATRIAVVVTN